MEKRTYIHRNDFKKAAIKSFFRLFVFVFVFIMASRSWADANGSGRSSYVRNNYDGSQTLIGHVPWEVANSTATFKYHVPSNQFLSAEVIVPYQNQTQLNAFLQGLYDPNSRYYHRFLTPAEFAQAYAPPPADIIEVQEFLKKQGIYVTGQSPNGIVLNVAGSVPAFEQAFGLHLNYYQKSDNTVFFAPDTDPTIPVTLAGKILAIGGLDNLAKYQAHRQQYPMRALPEAVGSGPGGFLAPADVKTAYNLNAIPVNGSGQNVALFELDGYASKDITAYESHFALPNVPLQNILVDGFNGVPNYNSGGADEVTLDIELVAAFAPGSSNILVYEAPNTTQSWIDEWTKIASDNKAKVISCSWGEPELDSPTLNFDNMIFQQMAAQGQAVFVAAGDNGAFDAGGKTLAVDEPASQPYATAVGISKLTTNSMGAYSGEIASVYGGGGVSAYWSTPSYQATPASNAVKAALVSTTKRNLPDVVLTADASTAYAFYINGGWAGYYGSSIAAPIWASFMSLVNQGIGQNGTLGFANPQLYSLGSSSSYANDFHDISTGTNGYYPAEPGFDDATGLGSFNGLNLYNDLLGKFPPVITPTVSLTAPSANAVFPGPGNIFLSANAFETNSTITQIQFYNGSTLLYTTTISPYSSTYNYTWYAALPGVYTLTAKATDSNGVVASSTPVTITVNSSSTNPSSLTAVITSPANQSIYATGSTISMTASASEINGTVAAVYFYKDGAFLGSSSTSPYTYSWTNVQPGSYTLNALSIDANGNSMYSSPITVTVTSSPIYTLTINPSSNGSVSVTSVNGKAGSGQASYISGDKVTLTATPAAGYQLSAWTGSVTGTSNPVTITMTANSSVGANFSVMTYNITATSGSNGSITPSGVTAVNANSSQVYTMTPNTGYQIAGITVNGTALSGTLPGSYTFSNVTANGSISATFAAIPYTLTISPSSNGSASVTAVNGKASSGQASYNYNDSVTLTATPAAGYQLSGWTGGVTGTSNPVTMTMTANTSVGATFTAIPVITSPSNTQPSLPTVSLTVSSNNTVPPSYTLSANASEHNGTITQVQFYNGTILLYSATSSPYNYIWKNVLPGVKPYTLTAKATDSNQAVVTSSPVTITVNPPGR